MVALSGLLWWTCKDLGNENLRIKARMAGDAVPSTDDLKKVKVLLVSFSFLVTPRRSFFKQLLLCVQRAWGRVRRVRGISASMVAKNRNRLVI